MVIVLGTWTSGVVSWMDNVFMRTIHFGKEIGLKFVCRVSRSSPGSRFIVQLNQAAFLLHLVFERLKFLGDW